MRLRIASSQALHPSFCPFGAKAQSRRCSSLPHQTHFVGLCWGPRDLFRRKFVCKTLGNTAQMCLRATADLFRWKFVSFSWHTQSMPAKNCLFPTQNLSLNPRRQFMRYCPWNTQSIPAVLHLFLTKNLSSNSLADLCGIALKKGCLKIEFSKSSPTKKVVKIRSKLDFHDFIWLLTSNSPTICSSLLFLPGKLKQSTRWGALFRGEKRKNEKT